LTKESDEQKLSFLGILIIKQGTNISSDIYFKPTDTNQYLNYRSWHPQHTKNSVPYFARRIWTIVSDPITKEQRLSELENHLVTRNYQRKIKDSGIQKANQIPKEALLKVQDKEQKDIVPYVSTFNPNTSEMFGVLKSSLFVCARV